MARAAAALLAALVLCVAVAAAEHEYEHAHGGDSHGAPGPPRDQAEAASSQQFASTLAVEEVAAAQNESRFDALMRTARAHMASERWERAIRDFRAALRVDPDHAKAKRGLFDACNAIRREDPEGNLAACVEREHLLGINPNKTHLHLLHHTLFFSFPPVPASCASGKISTFLGTRASAHVACSKEYAAVHPARNHTCGLPARCEAARAAARAAAAKANRTEAPGEGASVDTFYPLIDDEYWTWLDVLESAAFHVRSNASRFTMIDAYAGYGHWTVAAANAVRRLRPGHPMHFSIVEPFPVHLQFARETLYENRVCSAGVECVPYHAIISISEGNATIAAPSGAGDYDAQIVVLDEAVRIRPGPDDDPEATPVVRRRARVPRPAVPPEKLKGLGSGRLPMAVTTLEEIYADLEQVDLLLLDLRRDDPPGAELAALRGVLGSRALTETTRKVHIRTAPGRGEGHIRDAFAGHGWVQLHYFPAGSGIETPWGPVDFRRGVQTWINPNFQAGPSSPRSCGKPRVAGSLGP
eukprot:tig00020537_g10266.t1